MDAIKVLVVEDDPLFTKLVASMLQTKGCTVHGVSSGEQGIEALKSQTFDILITDLKMEGLGGVGLIQWVLTKQSFPITRILVITGDLENSEDSKWLLSHNIPILRKPFAMRALLEAVDGVLLSKP